VQEIRRAGGASLPVTPMKAYARIARVFARDIGLGLVAWVAATSQPAIGQDASPLATATAMQRLVVETIERAEKSVVAIARVRRDSGQPTVADNIAVPILPGLGGAEPSDRAFVPSEFGSGVVIDAKGLILTNFHVVGDHRTADYFIWLNRKPYPAKLKAADPWLDLAVLQMEAVNLKPIALGDARGVKKGQFVIALGNPYAIARDGQPSAAWGIIANLQRQAPAPRNATRATEGRETLHHWGTLIQTDARLELGASGGALVNLQGEMIGLTTSLAAMYGYERPGGFAIPVDDNFRRALDVLKTGRLPDYGFLGIDPASLTAADRQRERFGARVIDVVPATPAAAAGLRAGDIITHVEGQPVVDRLDIFRLVGGQFADTALAMQILRGTDDVRPRRPLTVKVKLSKKRIDGAREGFAELSPETWRGLRVEYATASPLFGERSRDLDPAGSVGVVEVARDSAAWNAGLRPGDFVSHVGEVQVATPREFYDAATVFDGDVTLQLTAVERDMAVRTVLAEKP
jgi:serine protease Do